MSDIDKRVVQFKDRARNDTPVYPYTRHYSVIDENNKELDDYLYEYNVNSLDPSAGPTTIYTLSGAIARVPNAYRNKRGLTLSFLSSSDLVESHIWVCGTDITDMGNDISSAEVPPLKKNWIDIIRTLNYARVSPITTGSSINSVKLARVTGSVAGAYGSISLGENCNAAETGSFASGVGTTASGTGSHAEGENTLASGRGSHAEGVEYNEIGTSAMADAAHAEGAGVVVKGQAAHGEGLLNVAGRTQEAAVAALADFPNLSGNTEQKVSKLIGFASHSEGSSTQALGTSSHAEGNSTQALVNATHAEGDTTTASGEAAHSEGYKTTASGNQSHSEGFNTQATANQAHSEGKKTIASAENAHSEGNETKAVGNASHSEGYRTYAYGAMSHIEGTSSTLVSDANAASESVESIWEENGHNFSLSRGQGSHVEGKNCLATGDWSHAEGSDSTAIGNVSHAEGSYTAASGEASHVEGRGTIAQNLAEHAEGKYNISIPNKSIHTVGIGDVSSRKNAHVITSDGLHYILGVGGVNGFESSASDLSNRTDLATYLNSIVGGTGPRRIVTSLNVYRAGSIPITLTLDLYNGRFGLDCNTAHIFDHDGQNIIYTLYTNMMNSLGQSIKPQSDLDGIYNDIVNYFSNATFDFFTTGDGDIIHNLYQCKEYVVDNVNEEAHFTFAREDDTQNLYYLYIYYGGPGGTGIRLEFEPF